MKNLLLLLLLLPALAAAKVPDEEDIQNKTMDAESPFYYPSLMMRYNAGDETLTDEDYHYLYYGYAYQESYKPLDSNPDLDKLLLMASGLDPDKPAVETLEAMLYTGEDALARDEAVQPRIPGAGADVSRQQHMEHTEIFHAGLPLLHDVSLHR